MDIPGKVRKQCIKYVACCSTEFAYDKLCVSSKDINEEHKNKLHIVTICYLRR
jgi:hypothetical protein